MNDVNNMPPRPPLVTYRSIGMAILLSIITCGIYVLYWLYVILRDLYSLTNKPNSAGTDILLGIVTCGIYTIYLMYKIGKLESEAHQIYNHPPKDDSILYLILGIFGLSIITYAIVQSNLNKFEDRRGPGLGPGPDRLQ